MVSFDYHKYTAKAGMVVLGTWIAFTTFYTLSSFIYPFIEAKQIADARQAGYVQGANETAQRALQSFSGNVFQNGQAQGQQIVVSQLLQELSKQYDGGCKEIVPVSVGTGSVGILSTACLQMLVAGSGATTK